MAAQDGGRELVHVACACAVECCYSRGSEARGTRVCVSPRAPLRAASPEARAGAVNRLTRTPGRGSSRRAPSPPRAARRRAPGRLSVARRRRGVTGSSRGRRRHRTWPGGARWGG
ncbi:unnamed protein product [Pelagomonas calceolata]|uniref:Uncharacterized protein n=1 Tax=Pelagomonas calceolata TaxID=35677 RepID=A0A8J2SWP5_9STRA|nr:unnamed protein product [Pelagomonas calceolata]